MRYYVYGAGGHGKVVLDAMEMSALSCEGFVDDKSIVSWYGKPVKQLENIELSNAHFHVAIGNGITREKVVAKLQKVTFFNIIHPTTTVARTAILGVGSFAAAYVIIGPDAKIGMHCILNHSAIIDHDCVIGNFSHIAPNATLGGGVEVGQGVLIGAGAIVLPGIRIGDYATIGAGAVVTKNVDNNAIMIGNPARKHSN